MTENVESFRVERDGNSIRIYFLDLFGEGECYTMTVKDSKRLSKAIDKMARLKG